MAIGKSLLIDQEFVAKSDTDKKPTIWMLRSLSGLELLGCWSDDGRIDHATVVEKGISGWKNFPDEEGKEIPFSQENIGRIPGIVLIDLSIEIQNLSFMTEEERKNSQSQS